MPQTHQLNRPLTFTSQHTALPISIATQQSPPDVSSENVSFYAHKTFWNPIKVSPRHIGTPHQAATKTKQSKAANSRTEWNRISAIDWAHINTRIRTQSPHAARMQVDGQTKRQIECRNRQRDLHIDTGVWFVVLKVFARDKRRCVRWREAVWRAAYPRAWVNHSCCWGRFSLFAFLWGTATDAALLAVYMFVFHFLRRSLFTPRAVADSSILVGPPTPSCWEFWLQWKNVYLNFRNFCQVSKNGR